MGDSDREYAPDEDFEEAVKEVSHSDDDDEVRLPSSCGSSRIVVFTSFCTLNINGAKGLMITGHIIYLTFM